MNTFREACGFLIAGTALPALYMVMNDRPLWMIAWYVAFFTFLLTNPRNRK